ncbi:unnamed protein product [Camellia sinensis]
MQVDSLDQQLANAINTGSNVGGTEHTNFAITCAQEKSTVQVSKRKGIKSEGTVKTSKRDGNNIRVKIKIPVEDILQNSELTLQKAAERLKVSKSTLKRACRGYGIESWPPCTINEAGCSQLNEYAPCLDQPHDSSQLNESAPCPHDTMMQDAKDVTVKAKCGDITMRFYLSLPRPAACHATGKAGQPKPAACHAKAKASSMPCHGQGRPAKASSLPCQGQGQQHAMPRPRQPSQSQQHAMPRPRPAACHATTKAAQPKPAACHAKAKASSMPCHGQCSPGKASSMPCQGQGQQHAMPRPRQPSQSQQHAMPRPRPAACHATAKASSMPCQGQGQQHAMPRPRPAACHAKAKAKAKAAHPKPATFHAKANAAQPKPAACHAKAKASRMSCHGLVPRRGVPWPWARTSHATPLRRNLVAGTYDVVYVDEGEHVLISIDDDLQDYMRRSRLLGQTSIEVLILPKWQSAPTEEIDWAQLLNLD